MLSRLIQKMMWIRIRVLPQKDEYRRSGFGLARYKDVDNFVPSLEIETPQFFEACQTFYTFYVLCALYTACKASDPENQQSGSASCRRRCCCWFPVYIHTHEPEPELCFVVKTGWASVGVGGSCAGECCGFRFGCGFGVEFRDSPRPAKGKTPSRPDKQTAVELEPHCHQCRTRKPVYMECRNEDTGCALTYCMRCIAQR